MVPSSPLRPWSARKAASTSRKSAASGGAAAGSISVTSCPRSRRASATQRPLSRLMARSSESPPESTAMRYVCDSAKLDLMPTASLRSGVRKMFLAASLGKRVTLRPVVDRSSASPGKCVNWSKPIAADKARASGGADPEGAAGASSYQILISSSRSTPNCSAIRERARSIRRSTSSDLALGCVTMKFAWRSLIPAWPPRMPFRPACSISEPALNPRGFLKIQPADWNERGCVAFFMIHSLRMRRVISCVSPGCSAKVASRIKSSSMLLARYPNQRSFPFRVEISPMALITVTLSTNWPMSPLRPPALPRSAPPTVPGMPDRVSRPASSAFTECEINSGRSAPAPARTVVPSTVIWPNESSTSCRTAPLTPSSRTRMFEPPPSTRMGICSSWQKRTTSSSSSGFRGRTRNCAGPPTFIQVYGASGSSRSEISLKASSKGMINPVDVPRAHRNHDVARAGFIVYCCHHPVKVGAKPRRSAAAGVFGCQFLGERVGFASANFPGRKDWRNQNLVGPLEALGKLSPQGPQARDLVRLEQAPDASPAEPLASRLERGPHFGRMMGEVVDPRQPPRCAQQLEAAAHSPKLSQAGLQIRARHADRPAERERRQRVEHVVSSGHAEREAAEYLAPIDGVERDSVRGRSQVLGKPGCRRSERERFNSRRRDARGRRLFRLQGSSTIGANGEQSFPRHARGKLTKGLARFAQVLKAIEVISLDVEDGGVSWIEIEEAAAKLAAFGHEQITRPGPAADAERAQLRADTSGRLAAGGAQHSGGHRRRRALAVSSGNADALVLPHQLAQHLAVRSLGDTAGASRHSFRVLGRNRGTIDHQLRAARHVLGRMPCLCRDAPRPQPLETRLGRIQIRAADRPTLIEQQPRERLHPGAADAHQVGRRTTGLWQRNDIQGQRNSAARKCEIGTADDRSTGGVWRTTRPRQRATSRSDVAVRGPRHSLVSRPRFFQLFQVVAPVAEPGCVPKVLLDYGLFLGDGEPLDLGVETLLSCQSGHGLESDAGGQLSLACCRRDGGTGRFTIGDKEQHAQQGIESGETEHRRRQSTVEVQHGRGDRKREFLHHGRKHDQSIASRIGGDAQKGQLPG